MTLNEAIKLIRNNETKATFIDLSCTKLSCDELKVMCEALKQATMTKSLLLNNCEIDDKGANHIFQMLKSNQSIDRLELACNKLSRKTVDNFLKAYSGRFSKHKSLIKRLSLNQHTNAKKIDILDSITKEEFKKRYAEKQVPVVIRNGAQRMDGYNKWSIPYLSEVLGPERLTINIQDYSVTPKKVIQMNIPLKNVQDLITSNQDENVKFYCVNNPIINHHEILRDEIIIPDWAKVDDIDSLRYIWIGPQDSMSSFHYDRSSPIGNIFIQVCGRKFIRLYDKKDSKHFMQNREKPFRITPQSGDDRVTASSIHNIDEEYSSNFNSSSGPWIVTLNPGDIFFMPAYFWHDVRALDASISVNSWLIPEEKPLSEAESTFEREANIVISQNKLQILPQLIENFLLQGGNPNYFSMALKKTSLLSVCTSFNLIKLVTKLLQMDSIDPNATSHGYPYPPLYLAIQFGFDEIANLILDHQETHKSAVFTYTGETPITLAATYGRSSIIYKLIKQHKIDPEKPDTNGNTPITLAKKNNHKECINLLSQCIM